MAGTITVEVEAEQNTYLFELGPQDCAAVEVMQQVLAPACATGAMTIKGYAPGDVARFTGLDPTIATEAATWSTVKALYD